MSPSRSFHAPSLPVPSLGTVPRAHLDPINSPADALQLVALACGAPSTAETLVIVLDDRRCGIGLVSVAGTDDPDAFVGIVDSMVDAAERSAEVAGLVIASVRPAATGIDPGDPARWREADLDCRDAAIDLVEWFVVGTAVWCPRDACGVSARWAQSP